MADNTAIEWTHRDGTKGVTWNPTTGCDKISEGCGLPRSPGETSHGECYALTLAKRLKGMGSAKYQNDGDPRSSGPGFGVTMHPDALPEPLRWRKPRTVFVNSMSDLGHARINREFLTRVWAVMAATPQHTYQILTKRPSRMARILTDECGCGGGHAPGVHFRSEMQWAATSHSPNHVPGLTSEALRPLWRGTGWPLPNVWMGTSIELDKHTGRADDLRDTPAAVRFISAEPLLGPLPSLDLTGIDWLIAGGESGPGARPMHPGWVRDLRDRCVDAGVAFFFKQWGAWVPPAHMPADTFMSWDVHNGSSAYDRDQPWRVGKKAAGRELDGRTWDEYPAAAHA